MRSYVTFFVLFLAFYTCGDALSIREVAIQRTMVQISQKSRLQRLASRLADLLQREAEAETMEREMKSEEVVMERGAVATVAAVPTAESEYAKEALRAHTAAREERKASNMMHLTWDQALADLAAEHANKCVYEHGTLNLPDGTVVGQNMATAVWSEAQGEYPAAAHVQNWVMELKYFNNATATCDEMGDCGHYSQMVWASTTKLGCAHQFCPNVKGGSDMIVCNYLPFGNEDGAAYERNGAPCSGCNLKGGTACVDGQCVDCEQNPELSTNHDCKPCDPSLCKDDVEFCGTVLEDICHHQMWQSFANKYCRKFCKLCEC